VRTRITRSVTAWGTAVALAASALLLVSSPASAVSLTEVPSFGTNPSMLKMYLYVPSSVTAKPAVVVAVHYCHGSGPAFFQGSQYATLAEKYGFILIFPSVTQASDSCFDVASQESLTHGGGSDSLGIVSMVKYVEQHYGADPERVFATGVSSGAMMTNVLLGAYPDVFRAGSAFAGVPFGCFAVAPDSLRWSTACATGKVTHTPQEWGDLVRNAYPGYTGARPRIQLWHGTDDETLDHVNLGEEIKQWTNVHGLSTKASATDSPAAGQTRTRYADSTGTVRVEAYSLAGVSHSLPVDAAAAIHFFGLDVPLPTPSHSPGPSGTCTADVSVISSWSTGFVAKVTVTAGAGALTGWTVRLTLPEGATVTSSWNGSFSGSGSTVTVTAQNHNKALAADASTDFGFQGSGSGYGTSAVCMGT
jgi:acetylxylan esterase